MGTRAERAAAKDALQAAWRAARGTFHEDLRLHRSGWMRFLWMAAGIVSAVVGIAGVLLPVLPGTPFLVLSAVCWVRSSPRLYVALLENRWIGPTLFHWRRTGQLEPRFRLMILVTLVVSVAVSTIFIVPVWWARACVLGFGVVAFVVVWRIPAGVPVPDASVSDRDRPAPPPH